MLALPAFSQSDFIPIDYKGELPSGHSGYMPNKGQLTAMQGGEVPDVLYYSIQARPQMFFTNKNEVFFQLGARDSSFTTPDTIYRVGMKFIGPNVNLGCVPNAYEAHEDHWNFVLGHLAQPILGQHAFRRIVYPDVYPNIDFHAYSNPWGPKFYFVMRPGSDPADLRLQFMGQDSLILDAYDQLKAYAGGLSVVLPKGLSYQQINGTTMLVDAAVDYELFPGEISVGFAPSAYDPMYPLVIDVSASLGAMGGGGMPPEWATFYGHTETDFPTDARVLGDGSLLVCGRTHSPAFPLSNQQDGVFEGSTEGYVSEFTHGYARRYTTLFGGNGADTPFSIDVTNDEGSFYILGRTVSTNLLVQAFGSGFFDNTPEPYPAGDSFIARFSRQTTPITPELVTYFGQGISSTSRIRIGLDNHVHVIGNTWSQSPNQPVAQLTCQGTTGTFPICDPAGNADFTQALISGAGDVFYCHFDEGFNLVHSTFFGGAAEEHANDLVIDPVTGNVYFSGNTASRRLAPVNCQPTGTTGGFPLCNLPGAYFQQNLNVTNTAGLNDGYIACLSPTGQLLWSTYVGSSADETGHYLGRNLDGSLYMSGQTTATGYSTVNCAPPTGSGFPNCASGSQVHYPPGSPSETYYIVRFNGSTKALIWSTFIQAWPKSFEPDEGGNMVVGLDAGPGLPTLPRPNTFFQPACIDPPGAGRTDALVMGFTSNDELLFSTYMGGLGNDVVRRAMPWSGGRLYLVGSSYSNIAFPFNCPPTPNPYCYLTYATQSPTTGEAYYAQLQYDVTIGIGETEFTHSSQQGLQVFPNPSDGSVMIAFGSGWLTRSSVDFEVHDAAGRLVQAERLVPRVEAQQITLKCTVPGAYVLRIRSGNDLVSNQLVLVR